MGKLQKLYKAGKEILLIEVESAIQAKKMKQVKRLAGVNVVMTPHNLYSTVKGVVRSKTFIKSTETSLRDCLAKQGVAEVRRIIARRDGELKKQDTYYILTFN